jgi:hypothetical protein
VIINVDRKLDTEQEQRMTCTNLKGQQLRLMLIARRQRHGRLLEQVAMVVSPGPQQAPRMIRRQGGVGRAPPGGDATAAVRGGTATGCSGLRAGEGGKALLGLYTVDGDSCLGSVQVQVRQPVRSDGNILLRQHAQRVLCLLSTSKHR